MAFAPDDPPGRIETALAGHPHATRAGGLRIDDTAGRAGLASDPLTVGQREGMGEAFEHACLGEAQEPAMHRAPRREVQRQMPPRASCPQHVQDAVKDGAQWPACGGGVSSPHVQVQADLPVLNLTEEAHKVLERAPEATDAPCCDQIELTPGDPLQERIVARPLLPPLGSRDALIGVDGHDDPTQASRHRVKVAKLILDGLAGLRAEHRKQQAHARFVAAEQIFDEIISCR